MDDRAPRCPLVAWEQAPALCEAGVCQDYHRVRPLLRWLGLAAEPNDHRGFLLPAITRGLHACGPRVLVSGTADEAMAAMVVEAGERAGVRPRLTVVDRCATPLAVNRAWARSQGIEVTTTAADILDYRPSAAFDLVVTHSFLGHFPPNRRPLLMRQWFELLAPGGVLITVARLRPDGRVRAFDPSAAAALAAEAVRRLAERGAVGGLSPQAVETVCRTYAQQRSVSHPLASATDLWGQLSAAGFALEQLAPEWVTGRVVGILGPGLPRSGWYVNVAARKIF